MTRPVAARVVVRADLRRSPVPVARRALLGRHTCEGPSLDSQVPTRWRSSRQWRRVPGPHERQRFQHGRSRQTCGVPAVPFCGTRGQFRWNRKNVCETLALPIRRGHRTSPTPSGKPGGGATRRRGSTRAEPACWGVPQRQGDEAAGTRVDEMSIGSVTGTGHPKGPCDSYSQGPFTISGPRCPEPALPRAPDRDCPIPLNHGENSAVICGVRGAICGRPANFGGTRRMLAKSLARPSPRGHRTSPTPSGKPGGGTARRRGSTRWRASLLGTHRGGWVTRPPGPEWRDVDRERHQYRSTGRALGTHTFEGPSPISDRLEATPKCGYGRVIRTSDI